MPARGRDWIRNPIDPIGRNIFLRAQRDSDKAYASYAAEQAAAAPPSPP
ncbi:hypothetical protein A2U01_0073371, partial [Trifolium medium]|nr:hypothetical protein [Trifolium medium]